MDWHFEEKVDLSHPHGALNWPDLMMVQGDHEAHEWRVWVYDNDQRVSLAGYAVTAYFDRGDGMTVPVNGSVVDGKAVVKLPQAVYAVKGTLLGVMRASKSGQIMTLAAGRWQVRKGPGDQVVDPGQVIPSLTELMARIQEMEQKTAEADAAATRANEAVDGMDGKISAAVAPVQEGVSELKDDLGLFGHRSSNLLKFESYEITTPNDGVNFSMDEDGKIHINGTASDGSFVVTLTHKDIKLSAGEPYSVNVNGGYTNLSFSLRRKVDIAGTFQEVVSYSAFKSWSATDSILTNIVITLPSGYGASFNGYIWLTKGDSASDYEPVGFISDVAKNIGLDELEKQINDLESDIYEKCGLVKKKGVFVPILAEKVTSGIAVEDAPIEYSRYGRVSKKITVSNGTPTGLYDIEQQFTKGSFDFVTVLMYLPIKAFNNRQNVKFMARLKSSKYANKNADTIFVDSALTTFGWGAYKIPISKFTFYNGSAIEDMDRISVRIRVMNSPEDDIEIILGGFLFDEVMTPTVVMSFDGVYDTDTVPNGKFDLLVNNRIHSTMFQSVNTVYSDETKSAFYNHVINDGFEVQMYATANRDYVQTEENPEIQYTELRNQKEWLYENRIGGVPVMYAAPNGILPNTTFKLLRNLGFKMSRSGSAYFVSNFTDRNFNVGSVGLYGDGIATKVKGLVDEAITDGKCLFLFTHKVKDSPSSYDCSISEFTEICNYIGSKIQSGELQSMNFSEFYNACVN